MNVEECDSTMWCPVILYKMDLVRLAVLRNDDTIVIFDPSLLYDILVEVAVRH